MKIFGTLGHGGISIETGMARKKEKRHASRVT
jgi:hypothetical protein